MIPLRLNLLSPQKKNHLVRMFRFQSVKQACEIFFITASIIGMMLLGSQIVLQQYFSALTENIVSVNNRHTSEIKDMLKINKLVRDTHTIQEQYTLWTPYLIALASSTPTGITLSSVSINYETQSLSISGDAQTREDLVLFEDSLKNVPFIENALIPLSSLAQKEHIPFTITGDLKKDN